MVSIAEDGQERTVDVPDDFAKSMTKTQRKAYDSMSYTYRREYVQWIESAKKHETRLRRIAVARTKLDERVKSARGRTP